MNRYDMIKKNLIYEEKIYYKKDEKQYIGCLVKSKYADQYDQIEFDLFENTVTRNLFHRLDLIEYNKAEICIEQMNDVRWKTSSLKKTLFYFQLIPKHQQEKEMFACETEENRTKWIKILNENIEKFNTNDTYVFNSDDENFSDEDNKSEVVMINNVDTQTKPAVPPRSFNSNEIKNKISKINRFPPKSTALIHELNSSLLKPKKSSLNEDDIFYQGTFEELYKILLNINKPGVYAVSKKLKPESDCTLAIRVYENNHTPISSWNIYQNKKTNKYYLSNDGLSFDNIINLCSYYTKHDLPSGSNAINRLILPYKHYLN